MKINVNDLVTVRDMADVGYVSFITPASKSISGKDEYMVVSTSCDTCFNMYFLEDLKLAENK